MSRIKPNPLYPTPDGPAIIAISSDWHGNTFWGLDMIRIAHANGATVMVHLGDFGLWRNSPSTIAYISKLNKLLVELGMWLLFVDGNHEDHERLDAMPIDPVTGMRKVTNRIWHLPRGFRWRWHDKVWMSLGGAHSVERAGLTPMVSWWAREFLSEREVYYAMRPNEYADRIADNIVDVMVCHDAPTLAKIPKLSLPAIWPLKELELSAQHRALIQMVVDEVKPAILWHGHYHERYDDVIELDDGRRVIVRGLSEDGTWSKGNLMILDLVHIGPNQQTER